MAAKNQPKEVRQARQARWQAWQNVQAAEVVQAIAPSPARQGAVEAAREAFAQAMKVENAARERFAS